MAQTSSAAREPSMEEILASIRRIIEDSDVARYPDPIAPFPPQGPRGEVTEFIRPVSNEAKREQDDETQSEKSAPANSVANFKEELTLRGTISDIAEFETGLEQEDDEPVLAAQNDDHHNDEWVPKAMGGAEALSVEETQEDDLISNHSAVEEGSAYPAASEGEGLTMSKEHILSEVTERYVATAFENLDHAMKAEPPRSFDDIAADIMRPMLQEWLDKNLPSLVERLVREEIERVVRRDR